MENDKKITATVIDALYIGKEGYGFTKEENYRLRAVRSSGGLVKIKLHKPEGEVVIYGSEAHFNSAWLNVKKVALTHW